MAVALPSWQHVGDEELMRRVGGGDAEAFAELYSRYVRLALRVARAACPDAGHAEDSVQEAFLSIWHGRARYRSEAGSFRAWALTLVRRRAIDSLRREAAGRCSGRADLAVHAPDTDSISLPDAVIASSEGASLRAALRQLPRAQGEVIALAFFGGLSHTEIAAQLGLAEGTVKGRMRLGMHKLRARMERLDAAR